MGRGRQSLSPRTMPTAREASAAYMSAPTSLHNSNEVIKRTRVVRIFPRGESCLRLVRALAVEIHESWLEEHRYLNMQLVLLVLGLHPPPTDGEGEAGL